MEWLEQTPVKEIRPFLLAMLVAIAAYNSEKRWVRILATILALVLLGGGILQLFHGPI